jgi:hypothetical protein
MKDRGVRRADDRRIKSKYRKVEKSWSGQEPSAKAIGKQAAVHGKGCSCSMCGNPRRTYRGRSALTMQEIRELEKERVV